jgi:hypothetical protein
MVDGGLLFLEFMERSTEGRSADFFNGTYRTHGNLYFLNVGARF